MKPINPLTDRIQSLTPEQRALFERQLRQKKLDGQKLGAAQAPSIVPRGHGGPSPLTFDQERLWQFQRRHPDSYTYNVYGAARLKGRVRREALSYALNEIVKRHEAWRTVFGLDEPVQVVQPELHVELPEADFSAISDASEREDAVQRAALEEVQRPFDLHRGPLIRFKLLRLSDSESLLVLAIHHIVMDRITFSILFEELMLHYNAALTGVPARLPELAIQFADFAEWQRNVLKGEGRSELLAFWKRELAGSTYVLDLATDFPRPPVRTFRGARTFLHHPRETVDTLKRIAGQENATAFMAFLAVYYVLLYRCTEQADLLIGTPLANRGRRETAGVMGYFLTMGALRARLSDEMTFTELLRQVRDTALGVYKHQEMPFGLLLDELQIPVDPSRNALVQAVFVYVDVPGEKLVLPELEVMPSLMDGETVKYDITIGLTETEQGMDGFFEYSPDLFRKETFERITGYWSRLLHSICLNPHQTIGNLTRYNEEL